MITVVDAHLDLAYNAVRGRDLTLPALQQVAPMGEWLPSVGLPDLVAGNVKLVCATLFCQPQIPEEPGYRTAEEARAQAQKQLRWYYRQVTDGRLRIIGSPAELDDVEASPVPLAIILLEGADALRAPEDVAEWYEAGLRIVGLAWKRTRLAGGTGEPGGLTEEGRALVKALDARGIIHDVSHLAEQAFWDLLEASPISPVIASHSNCRSIVPTDRQLSDEMIRAVAARGGVIGINFFDKFLLPRDQQGQRRANLADVVAHVRHIADLVGSTQNIGIGTDMDGGFGGDRIPQELRTSADLPRVADALSAAGLSPADIAGIMGQNWLRFFRERLPAG